MSLFSEFKVGEGSEGEFPILPPGEYIGIVEQMDLKQASENAKDPEGEYLSIRFQVVEGEYKNRIVFDNWTYKNKSEVAQNIGRGKVTSLAKACGFAEGAKIKESQIMNKAVIAVIGIQEGSGNYSDKNFIKSFKPKAESKSESKVAMASKSEKKKSAWDDEEDSDEA